MQSTFKDTMNQDNLFHLMLHSDIDTVVSICITHRIDYCNDAFFWEKKFDIDNLPILTTQLPTTLKEWRREYIRVETASLLALDLLQLPKTQSIIFNYSSNQFNFKDILPFQLRSLMYYYHPLHKTFQSLKITYQAKDVYWINTGNNTFTIHFHDLHEVLTIIFYHYPNIPYILN